MFDFAWSEIALIGVVALVLIGPKDMPVALKDVSGADQEGAPHGGRVPDPRGRHGAGSRSGRGARPVREIRSLDIRGTIARAVDSDGSHPQGVHRGPDAAPPPPVVTTPVEAMPEHTVAPPADAATRPRRSSRPPTRPVAAPAPAAPAFIPPGRRSAPARQPCPGPAGLARDVHRGRQAGRPDQRHADAAAGASGGAAPAADVVRRGVRRRLRCLLPLLDRRSTRSWRSRWPTSCSPAPGRTGG